MDINEFRAQMEAVKWFKKDEDYHEFSRLVDGITGKEDIEWLDCLLDSICVEDDYGPYESLYNAIWNFPPDAAGKRLAEYLPVLQHRMSHAPFQVWRFYIPVPQQEESAAAFVSAALQWNKGDSEIGRNTIKAWCEQSASDETAWMPMFIRLGGKPFEAVPVDPISDSYNWPDELKQRLAVWRDLPAEKNSEKVFWFGGKSTHMEQWRLDLPHIVEALALRHGKKWRDVNVWMNPFGTFGKALYPEFVDAIANAPEDVRDRALANIRKSRKATYYDLCERLKAKGVSIGGSTGSAISKI